MNILLESNNWTVHMHATNCIFNRRHRNGNEKTLYAVRNFKIWSYVEQASNKEVRQYARGGGHPLSLPFTRLHFLPQTVKKY